MDNDLRKHYARIAKVAAEQIWNSFEWLNLHYNSTPYYTGEYEIDDTYIIYAYDEYDTEDVTDHWINISLEKYNDQGKCIDPVVVHEVTDVYSKNALRCGIYRLLIKFSGGKNHDYRKNDNS